MDFNGAHDSITGMQDTVFSDLRNGDAANVAEPARDASIPSEYFWDVPAVIALPPAAGAAAVPAAAPAALTASQLAPLAIRSAYGRIVSADVAMAPAITAWNNSNKGAADITALATAGETVASARTKAIIIGAARAGIVLAWRVNAGDLNVREVARTATFTVNAGNTTFTSAHAVTDANLDPHEVMAMRMAPLSLDEEELAFGVMRMAGAIPPIVGMKLHESAHHFLSSDLKAVAPVERQVLSTMSTGARAIWDANLSISRDSMWHKPAHPLNVNFCKAQARSVEVKRRLVAFGLGSAAVRLPFMEPQLRAAKAFLALQTGCSTTLQSAQFVVVLPVLRAMVAWIETTPLGAWANASGPPPDINPAGITVTSREAAIEEFLVPATETARPVVAWLAGFYAAQCEAADVSVRKASLLSSRAVARAVRDHVGPNGDGKIKFGLYTRWVKNLVDQNEMPEVRMSDAGAPVVAPAPAPGPAPAAANP